MKTYFFTQDLKYGDFLTMCYDFVAILIFEILLYRWHSKTLGTCKTKVSGLFNITKL